MNSWIFHSVVFYSLINSIYSGLIPHPHGEAIQVQKAVKEDGKITYEVDYDKLYNFFSHPEIKDRKIVAFSIIGAYRKGKSFFLDYCLRFLYANYKSINTLYTFDGPNSDWLGSPSEPLSGFSWKAGRTADTQGILFWSDIFLYDDPQNGEKIAIIIMDTQGLFEPGVSSDLNARIFGLSTLISSIQVINLSGVIQEDQLQYLEMSTQFTKLVQAKSKTNSNLKPFQEMIFLVRDWLDEDTGFGYEGGENVWKDIFEIESSDNKAAESVRKNIKNAFEKLKMFLLPHPGLKVTKKDFNGSFKGLDEEFMEYLKTLIESIFASHNLVVKKILGKEMTGAELREFVLIYFDAFNSDDIPKVQTILEVTALRETEKIMDNLKDDYGKLMSEDLDYSSSTFICDYLAKHKINKKKIIEIFREIPKLGDKDFEEKMSIKLNSDLEDYYKQLFKNVQKSYDDHQKFLSELRKLQLEAKKRDEEILMRERENEKKLAAFAERIAARERAVREQEERRRRSAGYYLCKIITLGLHSC